MVAKWFYPPRMGTNLSVLKRDELSIDPSGGDKNQHEHLCIDLAGHTRKKVNTYGIFMTVKWV